MNKNSLVYVAGHTGMVGSAIVRELSLQGYKNILTMPSSELDLRNQTDVYSFFKNKDIECVIIAAAKVGGIQANINSPVDFLMDNMFIQNNLISASHENNINELLFLSSACVYPVGATMPLKEESILQGSFEKTNEPYAIAKVSGMRACQYYNKQFGRKYFSVIPANSYGENDSFDIENSHVIPSLITKMHNAKLTNSPKVQLWGSGLPKREFLYVDDLANVCVFLLNNYDSNEFINIGSGEESSIKELTEIVKDIVGYDGELEWDTSKPDGAPRRIVDNTRINNLGWKAKTNLHDGIMKTYDWALKQKGLLNE